MIPQENVTRIVADKCTTMYSCIALRRGDRTSLARGYKIVVVHKIRPRLSGAWNLLGKELENGWKVIAPKGWNPECVNVDEYYAGTGGNFSVAYIVQKDDRRAFLKAIDLTRILFSRDVIGELRKTLNAYAFEKDILELCRTSRLNRIVHAIDVGEIQIGENLEDRVPYLVFELADGDVRRKLREVDAHFKFSWFLKSLHHISVGLMQLHKNFIAHQDVKPSNVLAFGSTDQFKIADLGRAARKGVPAPHEDCYVAGDPHYAPIEQLYGYVDHEWSTRRVGCDLYLLGSMITFFVLGEGTTPLVMAHLNKEHRPEIFGGKWNGDYMDVLPYVRSAFTPVVQKLRANLSSELSAELTSAMAELCDPDPKNRGHPLDRRRGNYYSLQRYVSKFDLLSRKAQIAARRLAK